MALNKVRQRVRDAVDRARPDDSELRARVEELEAEVQECRELNLRIAELTDVVVELLVPLADSDDPRVAEIVRRYRSGVTSAVDDRS